MLAFIWNTGSRSVLALFGGQKNGLKNKWLRAQAAFVIGLVLQAGIAAAQNLVFTTNSPVTPFIWIDTNFTDPARFYRIQIGP